MLHASSIEANLSDSELDTHTHKIQFQFSTLMLSE